MLLWPFLIKLKSKTWKNQTVPRIKLNNIYRNTKISGLKQGNIHNVCHPEKNNQTCNEPGKYDTEFGEKEINSNWPRNDTNYESIVKNIKTVIITLFQMFKSLD